MIERLYGINLHNMLSDPVEKHHLKYLGCFRHTTLRHRHRGAKVGFLQVSTSSTKDFKDIFKATMNGI